LRTGRGQAAKKSIEPVVVAGLHGVLSSYGGIDEVADLLDRLVAAEDESHLRLRRLVGQGHLA
jgi:hypothetical protein